MVGNKEYLGELFLIIGGFILAETIIKQFLEMANGNIDWWVLPLMALALISGGLKLRKNENESIYTYIYWGWLILSIILVVLVKNQKVTPLTFAIFILVISLIQIVSVIVSFFKKKMRF
jgi:hypothetical protein